MNHPFADKVLGRPIVYAAIKNFRWNDINLDLWGGPRTLRVSGLLHRNTIILVDADVYTD